MSMESLTSGSKAERDQNLKNKGDLEEKDQIRSNLKASQDFQNVLKEAVLDHCCSSLS